MGKIRTKNEVMTIAIECPTRGPHFFCPMDCVSLCVDIFKYKAGEPGEKTREGYYCGMAACPTEKEASDYAMLGD